MISLLLAAGAAAEPSAKFLALEQDTDGFGEFYGTESWRQTEEVVY